MGNCQAVDAAALVIQHPSGKIDRLYWSVSASEVMKMNPGHYVSLIIPITENRGGGDGGGGGGEENSDERTVRFTRVKLLRPNETLVLGRAYRLVTTQEVMKVLRAKKYAKMKSSNNNHHHANKLDSEPERKQGSSGGADPGMSELDNNCQVTRKGRNSIGRSKSWRPSLQSISEAANP